MLDLQGTPTTRVLMAKGNTTTRVRARVLIMARGSTTTSRVNGRETMARVHSKVMPVAKGGVVRCGPLVVHHGLTVLHGSLVAMPGTPVNGMDLVEQK